MTNNKTLNNVDNDDIFNNYKIIKEEIDNISNKNINDVKILCVSKTKTYEEMLQLKKHNINFFGENYVQEIIKKYEIDNTLNFHMIGHLQTNKVKYVIDKVSLIESLDSYKLADVIQKEAKKKNLIVNVLIQVNLFDEETKYGIKLEELENTIEKIKKFENIKICGIMTSSLFVSDPEENREKFQILKNKFDSLKNKYNNSNNNVKLEILSMGMSNDYKVAIECGSTQVRLGTSIFGARKNKDRK